MENVVYTIRAITNLHMGDIGSSLGVVDKSVQRDAVTGYPVIYVTSFKGALRKAVEEENKNSEGEIKENENIIKNVFGYTDKDNASKGKYRFNDAHLLFYPIRSDYRPYYLAVSPIMLEQAKQIMTLAGNDNAAETIDNFKTAEIDTLYTDVNISSDILAGDIYVKCNSEKKRDVENLFNLFNVTGEPALLYLSEKNMSEMLEQLPVITRNQLDNGISANLWYEEFVPRKSVFITLLSKEKKEGTFDGWLNKDSGYYFQMGANATVGYGYSLMQKVKEEEKS